MSLVQRLERLEAMKEGCAVYEVAERIAERHGVTPDEVLRRAEEIGTRIERWGLDAEMRRFARDHGLTEEQARARYKAALAELET